MARKGKPSLKRQKKLKVAAPKKKTKKAVSETQIAIIPVNSMGEIVTAPEEIVTAPEEIETAPMESGLRITSMFECTVCQKQFSRKTHLVGHARIHTGERPYTCDLCGKKFRNCSNMKEHRRIHTGERPYSCTLCKLTFLQSNHLKKHLKSCVTKKKISAIIKKKNPLRQMDEFPCLFCKSTYNTRAYLEEHLLKIHFSDIGVCFRCDICGNGYNNISKYYDHKMDHDEEPQLKYQCHICGDYFDLFCILESHLKEHEDKGKFRCDQCGKTYSSQSNLNIHINDHKLKDLMREDYNQEMVDNFNVGSPIITEVEETPTLSSTEKTLKLLAICDKDQGGNSNVNKKETFECQYCNRTFTLERIWRKHEQWHTTDAAKVSQELDSDDTKVDIDVDESSSDYSDGPKRKDFLRVRPKRRVILRPKRKPDLKALTSVIKEVSLVKQENAVVKQGVDEEGLWPPPDGSLGCRICNRSFSHLNYYNNHMKIHMTINQDLSCKVCKKEFANVQNLNSHRRQHVKDRLRSPYALYTVYTKRKVSIPLQ